MGGQQGRAYVQCRKTGSADRQYSVARGYSGSYRQRSLKRHTEPKRQEVLQNRPDMLRLHHVPRPCCRLNTQLATPHCQPPNTAEPRDCWLGPEFLSESSIELESQLTSHIACWYGSAGRSDSCKATMSRTSLSTICVCCVRKK